MANKTQVDLPFFAADASGPKHFNYRLTRAKLEGLADPNQEISSLFNCC